MKPYRLILPLLLAAIVVGGGAGGVRADVGCTPTNVLFYSGDSANLATALHADPSPCADYWISIAPITAAGPNLGEPRLGPCPTIHAFGPQFHCLAELRPKQWKSKLVGGDWHATGVKLHDDMLLAGFDPARDTWAVNEIGVPSDDDFNTGVFTGATRLDFQHFADGLAAGSSGPAMPGLVFAANPPQYASNLDDYEQGLAHWYADAPFWQAMQHDVRFWAQETYADVRSWGVDGASVDDVASHLNDYNLHGKKLATGAAADFFAHAYVPLGNATYRWAAPPDGGPGFGSTDVPIADMLTFVSAQTYALRTSTPTAFGFAISAKNSNGTLNAQIYARLATAIHDSESGAAGACTLGCTGVVPGAAFTERWHDFATPPTIVPHVDGQLGADGWYTSDVTISWDVADAQTPIWSSDGCDTVVVAEDTAGTTSTCTATSSGGTASASVTVKRDATAPTLTCTPSTDTIWPPNHKLVPVTVDIAVADATSGPAGPAETIASELLRADKGAAYELTYEAADTAGNTGSCTVEIDVPHDQGP